jgi:hypothetical protein
MTSSIPTFLPETIALSELPAVVPGSSAMVSNPTPDFAGMLAEAAPVAALHSAPAVLPFLPGVPADVPPAQTGGGTVLSGVPAPPPAGAGVVRRFAPVPGDAEQAGENPAVGTREAPEAATTPTRAEQEEAMAMLVACFPHRPVAAPLPPTALAPVAVATVRSAPVNDAGPVLPGVDGDAEPAGRPARARAAWANRTEPTDPAGRSEVVFDSIQRVPRDAPPGPGRRVIAESPGMIRGEAPVDPAGAPRPDHPAAGREEDAERARKSSSRFAGLDPAPVTRSDPTNRLDAGDDAPRRVPEEAMSAAGEIRVLEAAVMRPDGVRLARSTAADMDASRSLIAAAEKSAGTPALMAAPVVSEIEAAGKKLLSVSKQSLAEDLPDDGTTAANAGASMTPHPHHAFAAPAQDPAGDVKRSEAATYSPEPRAGRAAAGLAAPRVLSTVLEVVAAQEASRLRPVPAVHLRMEVAGETIGIKVELRDATVQTHFSAVSPELREALAREWQAARSEAPAGSPRLSDPVFSANTDRGGSGSTGQDAASQQQSQPRAWNFPGEQSALPGSRRPRPAGAVAVAAADPTGAVPLLSAVA